MKEPTTQPHAIDPTTHTVRFSTVPRKQCSIVRHHTMPLAGAARHHRSTRSSSDDQERSCDHPFAVLRGRGTHRCYARASRPLSTATPRRDLHAAPLRLRRRPSLPRGDRRDLARPWPGHLRLDDLEPRQPRQAHRHVRPRHAGPDPNPQHLRATWGGDAFGGPEKPPQKVLEGLRHLAGVLIPRAS